MSGVVAETVDRVAFAVNLGPVSPESAFGNIVGKLLAARVGQYVKTLPLALP